MTMGTDWDESSLPYVDPRNSETAMDNSPDRYRYILERPVVDMPGSHWIYCGGATALLARLIAKGAGKSLHDFAREFLFDPLGMGPTQWAAGADGEPFAASGARMSVRDLSRIGTLMLSGGQLNGKQIVPAEWITRCTTPVVSSDELRRYGYQWFLLDVAFGKPKGWAAGRLRAHVDGAGGRRATPIHHSCVAACHCFDGWKLWNRRSVDTADAGAARNRFGQRHLNLSICRHLALHDS